MRLTKWAYAIVFAGSREGRAAEIVGWSNAVASLAIGVGLAALAHAPWALAALAAVVTFVLLRVGMASRKTAWVVALLGVTCVGGAAGALGWVLGHIVESWTYAPAVLALVASAAVVIPAGWAYARLLRRRADDVPDSLVDPVSLSPQSW
jgi:hypothetical protein